jgi:hypothetical protein
MLKKINPCTNCSTDNIVVLHHAGKGTAWPQCQKCGYSGSDKYKNHMIIDAGQYIKDGNGTAEERQELLDFAANLWNEIIGLERLESDPEFAYSNSSDDEVENEIDLWYDISTEDLTDDDEEEEDNVYRDWFGDEPKNK